MAKAGGYRAPSVGRALNILELVSQAGDGLGVSELARRLELSKGTVFGLCSQLEAGGALVRDPSTKLYLLGPFIPTLARRGSVLARLSQAAAPEMARLVEVLDESVFLAVMGRREVTVVETRQPGGKVGISAPPGTRLPLVAGAVGRVLLAGVDPPTMKRIVDEGLSAYTPHTVTDPDEYTRRVALAREQGYAVERNEYLMGMWGAAVALSAQAGMMAALYVVGFTGSSPDDAPERAARELARSRQAIEQNL